jgi:hypothetical protein
MIRDSLLLVSVGSCAHRVKERKTLSPSLLPGDHLLYPLSHDGNQRCPRNHRSDVPTVISPCGICRQTLVEFCHVDMPVFLVPAVYPQKPQKDVEGQEDEIYQGATWCEQRGVVEETVGSLLPSSFSPEALDRPRPRL